MYLLYPRLSSLYAEDLVKKISNMPVQELFENSRSVSLELYPVSYAPTGGQQAREKQLQKLQEQIRDCAKNHGYPKLQTRSDNTAFDLALSKILYYEMNLHPSEASHIEMWAFMTCVLLPDVVRWRFYGDEIEITTSERFIGSSRGQRRNTFGRLWWRSYLLYKKECEDPFILLDKLTEDDLVQITERPTLAGTPMLAQAVGNAFLDIINKQHEKERQIDRRDLIRECLKRISRIIPLTMLHSLDEKHVIAVVSTFFNETAISLDSR